MAEIAEFRPEFQFRLSASQAETKLWPKFETLAEIDTKISFLGNYVTQKIKKGNFDFCKKIIFVERLSPKMEVIGIPVRNHVFAIYHNFGSISAISAI